MLPRVVNPDTGVQHSEENCKININGNDEGFGTLYISEQRLIWSDSESRGVSLGYKDIAIHAISKDLQAFPEECLYVMYNGAVAETAELAMNGNGHVDDDSEDEEEAGAIISEIRLIPQCKDNLKKMFDSMSDCQCLHPDSEDSDDFCEGENADLGEEQEYEGAEYHPLSYDDSAAGEGFYTSEEGFEHLTPAGRATLERLENMLAQSHVSRPEPLFPNMEGVVVEEDTNPPLEVLPVIGRSRAMDTEDNIESVGEASTKPVVEGQFDDVD